MAAVLACGPGAVLSHRSAAELWRMLRGAASSPVHVTVGGDNGRRRHEGIALHRSSTLTPAECTPRMGIPVTKPSRTLTDLHRTFPRELFQAALRQAEYLRLPLGAAVSRDRTRSELESRLLALARRHRLPRPEVNVRVGEYIVDFLWRRKRLIAELDGWRAHGTRSAFEADRARDNRLRILGFEVVRFTWRQVVDEPDGVVRTIRALLASPGSV